MSGAPAPRDVWWAEFRAHGSVRIGLSRAKIARFYALLVFLTGVAIWLITLGISQPLQFVVGVLMVAVFPLAGVFAVDRITGESPGLVFDRSGIRVDGRRPLYVAWEEVVAVHVFRPRTMLGRRAAGTVSIRVVPGVVARHHALLPAWRRGCVRVLRLGIAPKDIVALSNLYLASPADLVSFLDPMVDLLTPLPDRLVLAMDLDGRPVRSWSTTRGIPADRLPLDDDTRAELDRWYADVMAYQSRPPTPEASADLAGRGRRVAGALEHALGALHQVRWVNDI